MDDGAGQFTYTPAAGFTGEDSFAYTVADAHGASDETTIYVYTATNTYFVSPTGDDANTGKGVNQAWQSVDQVVSAFCSNSILAGDVILFERGATFSGKLGVCNRQGAPGRPIVIGAYGSGAPPAIAGSDPITGWTKHAGNIWKATNVSGPVSGVYYRGGRQQPARSPNAGFYKNAAGGDATTLITPDLTGGTNAYAGATLRIRTRNWSYDVAEVAASSPGQLTLGSAIQDVSHGDWGYFIDNKLSLLDTEGEWYYDAGASTLYFNAPGDADPNAGLVEAVVRDAALEIYNADGADSSLVFDGITLKHASKHAVLLANNNRNIVLRRITAADSQSGIVSVTADVDIVESLITRTLGRGVVLGLANNRLLRSTLKDIAVVPGYGESVWGYMGVQVYGDGAVLRHNIIDHVGYAGVGIDGSGSVMEENYVTRSLAVLNDGGAISFDHCDGITIRKNIVVDSIGSYLDTVSQTAGPWVSPYDNLNLGIAFGNTSTKNVTIEANVVAHNKGGIGGDHTVNSVGNIVRDNLVFDNLHYLLQLTDQARSGCTPQFNDVYTGNIVVPGSPADILFFHQHVRCDGLVDWGTINKNFYATLYSDKVIHRQHFAHGELSGDYTLAQWQAESGQDLDSKEIDPALKLSASQQATLHYNAKGAPRIVALEGSWRSLDGAEVSSPITIPPYSGIVLLPK